MNCLSWCLLIEAALTANSFIPLCLKYNQFSAGNTVWKIMLFSSDQWVYFLYIYIYATSCESFRSLLFKKGIFLKIVYYLQPIPQNIKKEFQCLILWWRQMMSGISQVRLMTFLTWKQVSKKTPVMCSFGLNLHINIWIKMKGMSATFEMLLYFPLLLWSSFLFNVKELYSTMPQIIHYFKAG